MYEGLAVDHIKHTEIMNNLKGNEFIIHYNDLLLVVTNHRIVAMEVTTEAVQILGGYGYMKDTPSSA